MAITKVGESQSWSTTYGTNVIFIVPESGLYRLEAWGASGCSTDGGVAGRGGYASGYILLEKGEMLYCYLGGVGQAGSGVPSFNGGGEGRYASHGSGMRGGSGGGATHIARVNGFLADIGYEDFVTNKKGLIVAGGGGSAGGSGNTGGHGGGLSGTHGQTNGSNNDYGRGSGGTQTGGGNFNGRFGKGGGLTNNDGSYPWFGGGGGLFGGGSNTYTSSGGGSSFIGNLPEIRFHGTIYSPVTIAGGNYTAGGGRITITYIAEAAPYLYLGNLPVDALYLGDKEVIGLRLGDKEVA
ncbi:MAG: glycine-rich protein [bacterium]|nr:glycine-rich protein [bacterium]